MLQPNPTDRMASMADVAAWQPPHAAGGPSRLKWPIIAAGLLGSAAVAAVVFVAPRLTTETGPARVDEIGAGPAIGPPTGLPGGSGTGTGTQSRLEHRFRNQSRLRRGHRRRDGGAGGGARGAAAPAFGPESLRARVRRRRLLLYPPAEHFVCECFHRRIWLVAIGFRGIRDGVQNHVRFRASDQPEADHRRAMSRGQFHEDDRRRPWTGTETADRRLQSQARGDSERVRRELWGAARGRSARRRRWLRSQSLRVPEARGCLGEVPPPAQLAGARRSRPQLVFALASAQRLALLDRQAARRGHFSPSCSTRSERAGRAWTSP